ncbi:c-type cytochrome [bacterium SCSIO 12741]|nr:c-type cytochrome [bacterium SCSIO 12741]
MQLADYMKSLGLIFAAVVVLTACEDKNSPGVEYMPDMYRSPSYETYGVNSMYGDSMEARLPVANTIPRGADNLPYDLPNTPEGYDAAAALTNPLKVTEANIAEGKVLYGRFCQHCHGKKGAGDGSVVTNSELGAPQAYNKGLKDLPEGKMFHSVTYGKGMMGSHASQLTKTERWKILMYVRTLQNPDTYKAILGGGEAAPEAMADTTATAEAVAEMTENKEAEATN